MQIMLLYSADSLLKAEKISKILKEEGHKILDIEEVIKSTDQFSLTKKTESLETLSGTNLIVTIWTKESVFYKSPPKIMTDIWKQSFPLITVKCEPCELPLRYRLLQFIDMIDWDGNNTSEEWFEFIKAIEAYKSD